MIFIVFFAFRFTGNEMSASLLINLQIRQNLFYICVVFVISSKLLLVIVAKPIMKFLT